MIISASRRTDIPAFFMEEFMQQLRQGSCISVNPFNPAQQRVVSLLPEDVDAIVFWTKNPKPMLPYIDELSRHYRFYVQFTLNGYGETVEPKVPSMLDVVQSFTELSRQIGPGRCVWRYDPILFTDHFSPEWHRWHFLELAARLESYTYRCTVSLLDSSYRGAARRMKALGDIIPFDVADGSHTGLLRHIADTCCEAGMSVQSCASLLDLTPYGIPAGKCIDEELLSRELGVVLPARRDRHQRKQCLCQQAVDIGRYNTCRHGCLYCYATR
ncbi:MAG: DUF1848 domain-containing protein [Armatimonadota bacterium]